MAATDTITIKFKPEGHKDLTNAIKVLGKETQNLVKTQVGLAKEGKKTINNQQKQNKSMLRLEARFKALNIDIKKVGISTKVWNRAMKGSLVDIEKVKIATKKYNAELKKGETSTRILGGTFAVLRSKMLLFNFAMGLGIRQMMKMVDASAKVSNMQTAFNTLAGATENSSIALHKLQKATDGTMTSFNLFQQANNAMILGVTKNSDEMAEMFDIAQRLGRALGRDTASSVESLITGIGRQSRLMLDNIGIIVKTEEAYEKYAQKLNVTTDSLTDADKKQAFLEATMESARKKVKSLGDENLTSKDAFDQLKVASSELARSIGDALAPSFSKAAKASAGFLNNMTELIRIATHQTGEELNLALAREKGVEVLNKYSELLKVNTDKSKPLIEQLQSLLKIQKETSKVTLPEGGFFGAGFDSTLKTADNVKELERAINTLITTQEEYNAIQVDPAVTEAVEFQLNSGKMIARTRKEQMLAEKVAALEQMRLNIARNQAIEESLKKQKILQTEAEDVKKTVLGGTLQFQLEQLDILQKEYEKHHEATLESDQYFANQRKKIEEDANSQLDALKLTLRDDQRLNELEAIDIKAQEMRDAGLNEIKIKQWVADQKQGIDEKYAESEIERIKKAATAQLDQFKVVLDFGKKITSQLEKNLDSQVTNELEALKRTDKYRNASAEQRKTMETQVNSQFAKERKKLFEYNKAISMGDAVIGIAKAVIEAFPNKALMALVGAMGAVQLKAISSQQAPTYAQGGLVGGRRHSQGGTIIEAEKGEFVMSRNAVESIGVEAMNQINQGGGAGITVNVTAPLVDETVIDSIIPAIEKAQRLNLA